MPLRRTAALLVACALAPACGGEASGPACREGAECASGRCGVDGRCEPSAVAASAGAGAAGGGAGGGMPGCSANADGTVTREEVVVGPGLRASFRVAKDAVVDTAGVASPDGTRLWSLAGALPGDATVLVETQPLGALWFGGDYPGAGFASPLGSDPLLGPLFGVFEATEGALLLRGVASLEPGLAATKLAHAPAVAVLAFPLAVGASWSTTATVTGATKGLASLLTESYASTVDARGSLATPYGSFPVLRVATTLTRTVGALPTVTRSFAFVAECFGTVAVVTSRPNEPLAEFTFAAEARRLAP